MTKEDLRYFLQKICSMKKDDRYWKKHHPKLIKNLRDKIIRETPWLSGETRFGSESYKLPFHEQAIKYYEYKNMNIQRRAQYVIIFLTSVLLIMTGLQIYLNFFN